MQRELNDQARCRSGPALARPVPVVEYAERVCSAGVDGSGDVDTLGVLLVGIGKARTGAHPFAVDEEQVFVGGRDDRRGPGQRAAAEA